MAKNEEKETEETEEKPKLSKQDKQALFAAWGESQKAVEAAEETVAEANTASSECIKEIIEKCGKGPFKWSGKILRPAKRKGTDEYYFRGMSKQEIETI